MLIHERDYLKKKGIKIVIKFKEIKFQLLKKKSKRDFYNRAIKDNKNSNILWKNI